jgi:hypothetical protein
MMGTEMVPETLDFNELTRLSAREEFINFSRRESFTSYIYFYRFAGMVTFIFYVRSNMHVLISVAPKMVHPVQQKSSGRNILSPKPEVT